MIFDEGAGDRRRAARQPGGGGTLSYNGVVNQGRIGFVSRLAFDALRDLRSSR